MLIPGAVVYILMLCSLLMVIFLTGAFTIFPQDAARYIVSFALGKQLKRRGEGNRGSEGEIVSPGDEIMGLRTDRNPLRLPGGSTCLVPRIGTNSSKERLISLRKTFPVAIFLAEGVPSFPPKPKALVKSLRLPGSAGRTPLSLYPHRCTARSCFEPINWLLGYPRLPNCHNNGTTEKIPGRSGTRSRGLG